MTLGFALALRALVPAVALALLAQLATAQTTPPFQATSFPAGVDPAFAEVGDLNHDGRPDIAVVSTSQGTLSILLATPTGLANPATTSLPLVGQIRLADMNVDGKLDLVSASLTGAYLALGDGAGGFGANNLVAIGLLTRNVAVGDFNGDGLPDVLPLQIAGILNPALNTGGGAFAPATQIFLQQPTQSLELGDMDLDGVLDVLTWSTDPFVGDFIYTLKGNGNGTFGPPTFALLGTAVPSKVVPTDVNDDGTVDIVVLFTPSPTNLSVQFFPGTGTIGGFGSGVLVQMPNGPTGLAVGDLNRDGNPDVLTTSSGSVQVALGDGGGGFAATTSANVAGALASPLLADFDGDGLQDALAMAGPSNAVSMLTNVSAALPGIATFGTGTSGCIGTIGIHASSSPTVGNAAYGIACTNAPANSLLLGLRTNAAEFAGVNFLGLGVTLHVDMFGSTLVSAFNAFSDVTGAGFGPSPIPNDPTLVGVVTYAQILGVGLAGNGDMCSGAFVGLVSSRGIIETIQ